MFPLFWLALASPAAVANLVQVDNCCEIDAIKKFFQDFPGKDALLTDNGLVGIWRIGDYCDFMDQRQQRRLAWVLTSCHCSRENITFPVGPTWENPDFHRAVFRGKHVIHDDAYEFYDKAKSDIRNCTYFPQELFLLFLDS